MAETLYWKKLKEFTNQKFEEIIKSEKQFIDNLYPHIQETIGIKREKKTDRDDTEYHWVNINDVLQEYYIVKQETEDNDDEFIDDILQGELGDCYFLSALSALAEIKNRIKQMINNSFNKAGAYEVIAYISGRRTKIVLDNFIPCINYDNEYTIAFTGFDEKSKNVWPIMLEKAWAKVNLSYGNIVIGSIIDALQFLTPCPVEILKHNRDTNILEILKDADKKNFVICSDVFSNAYDGSSKLAEKGLISNHAYTVISIHTVINKSGDEVDLLKVRNPWGSLEWNGEWSDDSDCWTPELKKNLLGNAEDDGTFFIAFKDFKKFFTTTFICKFHDDYKYIWKDLNLKYNSNNIRIQINKNTHGYFIINQFSSRVYRNIVKDKKFMNSFCSIILCRINDGKEILIDSVCGREDRLFIETDISSGEYLLSISFPSDYTNISDIEEYTKWSNELGKEHQYVIGFYSSLDENDVTISIRDSVDILPTLVRYSEDREDKKNYFYQEGEPESWRCMTLDKNNESIGVLMYKNMSEAVIKEKIQFEYFGNISIVKLMSDTKCMNIKHNSLDIYEEVYESDFVKKMRDFEDYNSYININTNEDRDVMHIDIAIKPYSYLGILFIKNDEDTEIQGVGNVVFDYLSDILWSERKFLISKTRLNYEDKQIDVFESIIKHPLGLFFKYKNKTKEYKVEVTLKFKNLSNLVYNNRFDELKDIMILGDDTYSITLQPGSCSFVEMKAVENSGYSISSDIVYKIDVVWVKK